jgi:hypothetical protein
MTLFSVVVLIPLDPMLLAPVCHSKVGVVDTLSALLYGYNNVTGLGIAI